MEESYITSLTLHNFRNYFHLNLESLNPFNIVIYGPNGAGKTNILEAVSYLSSGSGIRNAKLNEIGNINFNAPSELPKAWSVNANLIKSKEEIKISTGYYYSEETLKDTRIIKIDGEEQKTQSNLSKLLNITYLTPQMDKLFLEPSEKRRRFLDKLISDFDPSHTKRLSEYKSAMSDRSQLIKQRSQSTKWLAAIEQTIVSSGIAIAASRLDFISKLNTIIKSRKSHFPKIKLTPIGEIEQMLLSSPAAIVEDHFNNLLTESRTIAKSGLTTSFNGPHKSDFSAIYKEKNTPASHASTGEQKSIIIALIFGYIELIKHYKNLNPILLLDEIPAHLDNQKKDKLFEEIKTLNIQTFYTGVFKESFKELKKHFSKDKIQFIKIENGQKL
jgi:DNA replication and repair protein RecF